MQGVLCLKKSLFTFLQACDRTRNFDLATRALVRAIGGYILPDGSIPPDFAQKYSPGVSAFHVAQQGTTLTRPQLRVLAELENALEQHAIDAPRRQVLQQLDTTVLRFVLNQLPKGDSGNLAHLGRGNIGEEQLGPTAPPEAWKIYTLSAIATFLSILGVASLSTALTYGGEAWWSSIGPLASATILAWVLGKRFRSSKIGKGLLFL